MIPYVKVPDFHPFNLTWVPIHPFGLLVATGVLIGTVLANRRARKRGLDLEQLNSFITWMLVGGFTGGHILDEVLYDPHRIVDNPISLLMLWAGLGSFPGFVGGVIGVVLWKFFDYRPTTPGGASHFVKNEIVRPVLPFCDVILSVFPVAWVFGRAGCSSVHDHPGAVAPPGAPLAVAFPSAAPSVTDGPGDHVHLGPITFIQGHFPRYDLGLLELMFAFVLASALALTWRRRLPTGTYVVVVSLTYAPVRFMMDSLRIRDVAGADPRYGGLTPAQWACLMLFTFGIATAVYMRRLRKAGVDPADVFRTRAPETPAGELTAA
jgi:phosphatidylglycerol---prolipoprotein diacylglyceryl transferase